MVNQLVLRLSGFQFGYLTKKYNILKLDFDWNNNSECSGSLEQQVQDSFHKQEIPLALNGSLLYRKHLVNR